MTVHFTKHRAYDWVLLPGPHHCEPSGPTRSGWFLCLEIGTKICLVTSLQPCIVVDSQSQAKCIHMCLIMSWIRFVGKDSMLKLFSKLHILESISAWSTIYSFFRASFSSTCQFFVLVHILLRGFEQMFFSQWSCFAAHWCWPFRDLPFSPYERFSGLPIEFSSYYSTLSGTIPDIWIVWIELAI